MEIKPESNPIYQVGIFLFDDIELLDFAGPYEVFSVTAELNDYQLFKVFTVAETGRSIKSVNGLTVIPDYSFNNHPPIDLLIIPGGVGTKAEMEKKSVLDWLCSVHESAQMTMSVCSGARLLGKLGLLDNLPATTHHEVIPHLHEISPTTIIKAEYRFVDNVKVLTSAGISAGMDLSLYLVEKLYGSEIRNKTQVYMEYGDWEKLL